MRKGKEICSRKFHNWILSLNQSMDSLVLAHWRFAPWRFDLETNGLLCRIMKLRGLCESFVVRSQTWGRGGLGPNQNGGFKKKKKKKKKKGKIDFQLYVFSCDERHVLQSSSRHF